MDLNNMIWRLKKTTKHSRKRRTGTPFSVQFDNTQVYGQNTRQFEDQENHKTLQKRQTGAVCIARF